MNRKLVDAFSRGSREALLTLAATPQAASDFHNGLAQFRAGLRIGLEVLEQNLADRDEQCTAARRVVAVAGSPEGTNRVQLLELEIASLKGSIASGLGVCAALECTMTVLAQLHPSDTETRVEKPKHGKNGLPPDSTMERFRKLDLDP